VAEDYCPTQQCFFFKNNIKMENYQKVDVMKKILSYLRARLRGVEYGRTTWPGSVSNSIGTSFLFIVVRGTRARSQNHDESPRGAAGVIYREIIHTIYFISVY
jgi:hypothetical protein